MRGADEGEKRGVDEGEDTSRRTYVLVADLRRAEANTEELASWLTEGWAVTSVQRVDDEDASTIVIIVTVESEPGEGAVARFRKGTVRRAGGRSLPH